MNAKERHDRAVTVGWLLIELARTETSGASDLLEDGWQESVRPVLGTNQLALDLVNSERRVRICRFPVHAGVSDDGPSVSDWQITTLLEEE
jgi:hypothetical protein